MFVDTAIFVFDGIGYDASGYGAGYLSDEYFVSLRCFDDDCGAFVFGAGFGEPGFVEIAVVVDDFFDDAFHGEPVGMDVGDGHEDGYHQATVVEIFIFFHFFYHYDFAIGCCYDDAFDVALELAQGTAEEIDCYTIEHDADGGHYIEWEQTEVLQ